MPDRQFITMKQVSLLSGTALLLILLFCLLNFLDHNLVHTIQVTDIDRDGLIKWKIDGVIVSHNYVWIEGWALIPSEPSRTFDLDVLLRNTHSGETILLPTMLVNDDSLNDLFSDGLDHSNSGFRSRVNKRLVDLDNNSYEIFLKFFNNGHHLFVETGQLLQE